MRYPSAKESLELLNKIVPDALDVVLDVGVQYKTPFLVEALPGSFHHLFEPVSLYHSHIHHAYGKAGIDYQLHEVALGGADGESYLYKLAKDGSGRVTHAEIRARDDVQLSNVVEIEKIATRSLNSLMPSLALNDLGFVVKLDVDGVEEEIIAGGKDLLHRASLIIIETSLIRRNVISRAQLVESLGFRLWDICDNAYYFEQLSQVDLMFINERLRQKHMDLRPWEKTGNIVDWENWQHGF